jgi:hypothetical protein
LTEGANNELWVPGLGNGDDVQLVF